MQLKNLKELNQRISDHALTKRGDNVDMICIGYGIDGVNDLHTFFDIPRKFLHQYIGRAFHNNYYGSAESELYFIPRAFYNAHVKGDTSIQDVITLAQSLIGKMMKGDTKNFSPEYFNLYTKSAYIPSWMPEDDKTIINDRGWVVMVESNNEFVNAEKAIVIDSFVQLNDNYSATLDGDDVVVGCQRIPKAKVLELAELIRIFKP